MLIELIEWFLDILDHDGYDIREEKGKMKMALALMKRTDYDFERKNIVKELVGEVKEDA